MINIKKLIEKWLPDRRQDEQYRNENSTPTLEGVANITNNISVVKGETSFDNANFGIIQNVYVNSEQPTTSQIPNIVASSVAAKLDSIQELASKCMFEDALTEYLELLGDFSVMNVVDKNTQSRVLLGIVSSYISMSDYKNAEKFLNRLKREDLPLDERGYSIVVSFYLNQKNPALYIEAERIATQALEKFPHSMLCICRYSLIKTIVDASFDGKQYLNDNIQSLDNVEDKKRYFETLCNIYITRKDSHSVISTYNELDFKPSLQLHSQYISALYVGAVFKKDKERIGRSDIDFADLYAVWQSIKDIEETLTIDEVSFFHCLISDVYLNCIILLGKESSQISRDLLSHAHEDTQDFVSFWLSVSRDYNPNSSIDPQKNYKVRYVDSLLKQRKYIEVYNYLWPAIKTDAKLQEIFKHLLMNVCIELRDEKPEYFIEGIRYFKQADLYDDYMRLIECTYIYHMESNQRALQEMRTLYEQSQDPMIIIELIRFAYRVREISFVSEKLDDIKHNKQFVIDIEPNDYFELCFRLYTNSQQGEEIICLIDDASRYSIDATLGLRMNAAKAEFIGDLPEVATANFQLYEHTDDVRYLYRSCEVYLALFDIVQLDNALGILECDRNADAINFNILRTYYYILHGDDDKAIETAKRAKDLAVDLPMSPAHRLYWSLCFRNGDIGEAMYVGEYAAKYPQHTHWVRCINAIEKDKDGNDILTSEAVQIFEETRDNYVNTMRMYKSEYVYGVSFVKDALQLRYNDITPCLSMIKVSSGNNELFLLERQRAISQIALDSLSLYFLEVLGCLELLKNCREIYIDYQTISLFSSDLLVNEDERVRKILRFITTSSSIIFSVPSKTSREAISKLYVNNEQKETSAFYNLLNTCVIAHDNKIPFVYLDMLAQPISTITNTDTVSLFAFLKSAHTQGWLTDFEYGKTLLSVTELNFKFLNIDCSDLYFSLLASDFSINESIIKLIKIEPSADVVSYMRVFIGLLQQLRTESKQEITEKIVVEFIKVFDKRHGRTRMSYYRAMEDCADYIKAHDMPYRRTHSIHSRLRELYITDSLNQIINTRIACEIGIASVCAFLFDFKSIDEVNATICEAATRIPQEKHSVVLDRAKEMYSMHLA